MFKEIFGSGEPQKLEANVSDIINAKYEELQKARKELMELRRKNAINMTFEEAEEITNDIKKLENVIPQLEEEFEALKKNRAEDLEKRFGGGAANDTDFDAALRATGEMHTADRFDAAKERERKTA